MGSSEAGEMEKSLTLVHSKALSIPLESDLLKARVWVVFPADFCTGSSFHTDNIGCEGVAAAHQVIAHAVDIHGHLMLFELKNFIRIETS